MIDVLELSKKLIQTGTGAASDRAFCDLLKSALEPCGVKSKTLTKGEKEHTYFSLGSDGPVFVYLGHSDVVPAGDESRWIHPPFSGYSDETTLYGRGAVDMRGSVAAFVVALVSVWEKIKTGLRVVIAIPSDEETTAFGAQMILDDLKQFSLFPSACLVGEPSAISRTGDRIRTGRRGGVTCTITFKGEGGHTAYAHSDSNILHRALDAAQRIKEIKWLKSEHPWSDVSFHFVAVESGSGASNVVPETALLKFNMRFGPVLSREYIIAECEKVLAQDSGYYSIEWSKGAKPYYTKDENFRGIIARSIKNVVGVETLESVDGGTSDGRFFAAEGIPTVEVGTPAKKLHETNESVEIEDLRVLVSVYSEILQNFAGELSSRE